MLTIATLDTGNYLSRGLEYTQKLAQGIRRNTSAKPKRDYWFVVYTDKSRLDSYKDLDGVDMAVPIDPLFKGWYAKLYLFESTSHFKSPVLFFDLDTIITGNIDELLSLRIAFGMLDDFYYGHRGLCGSGILAWQGNFQFITDHYRKQHYPTVAPRGDQGFIEDCIPSRYIVRIQDLVPGQIVSYKVHCQEGMPRGARVVCFHGKPKPHDFEKPDWVRDHWRIDKCRTQITTHRNA